MIWQLQVQIWVERNWPTRSSVLLDVLLENSWSVLTLRAVSFTVTAFGIAAFMYTRE